MGYYTCYTLDVSDAPKETAEKISSRLDEMEILGYALDDMYNGDGHFTSSDAVKWYDHEDDIGKLSIEFPDVHFILTGVGEESGDFWEKHFINGSVQRCYAEIVYPPFSPNRLTPLNLKKGE